VRRSCSGCVCICTILFKRLVTLVAPPPPPPLRDRLHFLRISVISLSVSVTRHKHSSISTRLFGLFCHHYYTLLVLQVAVFLYVAERSELLQKLFETWAIAVVATCACHRSKANQTTSPFLYSARNRLQTCLQRRPNQLLLHSPTLLTRAL
jgi:hypothetical protein